MSVAGHRTRATHIDLRSFSIGISYLHSIIALCVVSNHCHETQPPAAFPKIDTSWAQHNFLETIYAKSMIWHRGFWSLLAPTSVIIKHQISNSVGSHDVLYIPCRKRSIPTYWIRIRSSATRFAIFVQRYIPSPIDRCVTACRDIPSSHTLICSLSNHFFSILVNIMGSLICPWYPC